MMMKNISALAAGLLFGVGLAVSGMTDTAKVIGFLDITGKWVPDLAFVMGAAVLTTMLGFRVVFGKSRKPLFGENFSLPLNKTLDRPLILGASIFGIGWGLYGYCPGPAIASIVYLSPVTLIFLIAMSVGMALVHFALKRT
jgi:hypothetical protein